MNAQDSTPPDQIPASTADADGAPDAAPGAGASPFPAAEETPCAQCAAALETKDLPPFCEIKCPACGAANTVPARFGKYLLRRRLGSGGMGSVYLAQDTALGRDIAVKMLQSTLCDDPAALDGLRAEAQNAARLNHPNVAQIYSFGQEGSTPYVEMEFVPGQSLGQLIAHGARLDTAFVMRAGLEIAEGLRAAEAAGLFHGDIKPENILFDSEMKSKLVDFGIASAASKKEGSDELWGTPYYIAPEKVQKKKNSVRSDIYSLGATLYHAVAGEPPYEGEDATAVIKARFKGPPRPLEELRPDMEPEVARIIGRMMYNDLFMRYPNYNSLINDIRAYLAPIPAVRKQGPVRATLRAQTGALSTTGSVPPGAGAPADAPAAPGKPGRKFVIQKGAMEAQIAMSAAGAPPPAATYAAAARPPRQGGVNGAKLALILAGVFILLAFAAGGVWFASIIIGNSNAEKASALALGQANEAEAQYAALDEGMRSALEYVKERDAQIPAQIDALSAVYKEATGAALAVPDFNPPPEAAPAAPGTAPAPVAAADGTAVATNETAVAAADGAEAQDAETPAGAAAQSGHPELDALADRHVFAHARAIRAALKKTEALLERPPETFTEIKDGMEQAGLAQRTAALERRRTDAAALDALKTESETARKEMVNGVRSFEISARRSIEARKRAAQAAAQDALRLKAEEAEKLAAEKARLADAAEVGSVRETFAGKSVYIEKFDYARAKREMQRMDGELKTQAGKEELALAVERLDRLESLHAFLVEDVRKNGAVKSAYRLQPGAVYAYEIKGLTPDGKSFTTGSPKKEVPVADFTAFDWINLFKALLDNRDRNRSISNTDLGEQLFNAAIFCHVHGGGAESADKMARALADKALAARTALRQSADKLLPIPGGAQETAPAE